MKKALTLAIISIFYVAAALTAAEKSAKQYIADLDPGKDEQTIVAAADWLGKKEEKDAIKNLVKLIEDKRVKVRMHVVMALGYIGKEEAVAALNKSMLEDESAEVRYAAVLATVRIGSKKSIDAWKKALETESDPFIQDFLKKLEAKAKGK